MKPEFRLIIAGTRTFNDFNFLVKECDDALIDVAQKYNITIVSGKARGADELGEQYAKLRKYKIAEFPADWSNINAIPCKVKYRKDGTSYNALAGLNRNIQMAIYASQADYCGCLAFWDGKSTGTKHMIDTSKKYNIKCIIKKYERGF